MTELVGNRTRLGFPDLSKFKNTLLNHLDAEVIERLGLRPVTFEARHEIEFPLDPNRHGARMAHIKCEQKHGGEQHASQPKQRTKAIPNKENGDYC